MSRTFTRRHGANASSGRPASLSRLATLDRLATGSGCADSGTAGHAPGHKRHVPAHLSGTGRDRYLLPVPMSRSGEHLRIAKYRKAVVHIPRTRYGGFTPTSVLCQGRCRILARGGAPTVCIGSPAARSSGACGLASPVVPGAASLLAVRVSTRSDMTADAMAMAKAIADRIRAVRFWLSIVRPPRNGSIARG